MTVAADIQAPPAAVVGVTIWSQRPDELATFYARVLRVPLDGGVDHLSGEAMFRTQLGSIEFEIIGSAAAHGGGAVQPSVHVADVDAAVAAALDMGGSVHLGCATLDWGTYAVVTDTDGNRLGLYCPQQNSTSNDEEQA